MRINSQSINTFKLSVAFAIISGVLLFTYLLLAANIVREGYLINDLGDKISTLEKETTQLQIELSQSASLSHILEQSSDLLYSEIDSVSYIQKTNSSPFAAR